MGFARQVLFTYLVRILLVPAGVLSAVIVARWLGPSGQGIFAAVGAYIATAGMLGSLGLSQAVGRLAASKPEMAPALVANARITGVATGLFALVVLCAARILSPGAFGNLSLGLLLLAGLALPLNLASAQMQAVLLSLRRVRQYNLLEGLDRVLFLAGSLVLLVGLGMGVEALVAATAVFAGVRFAVCHLLLGSKTIRGRSDLTLLRRLGGVSIRAYLASLLAFLVLRSDLMLVHAILGPSGTGVYSIAVQFADLLLALPGAIGTLLFPRVAASAEPESAAFTATVCRHAVLAVTAGCLGIAATAWWLIPALFGIPFTGAVVCLFILLPGVWCMSLQTILANDLGGRDYPAFLPFLWVVILAINVGLNLAWLPTLGIAGAAASSTVAYALSLGLVAWYWLRRFPAIRPLRLFVLEGHELATLVARLRQALFPPMQGTGSTIS